MGCNSTKIVDLPLKKITAKTTKIQVSVQTDNLIFAEYLLEEIEKKKRVIDDVLELAHSEKKDSLILKLPQSSEPSSDSPAYPRKYRRSSSMISSSQGEDEKNDQIEKERRISEVVNNRVLSPQRTPGSFRFPPIASHSRASIIGNLNKASRMSGVSNQLESDRIESDLRIKEGSIRHSSLLSKMGRQRTIKRAEIKKKSKLLIRKANLENKVLLHARKTNPNLVPEDFRMGIGRVFSQDAPSRRDSEKLSTQLETMNKISALITPLNEDNRRRGTINIISKFRKEVKPDSPETPKRSNPSEALKSVHRGSLFVCRKLESKSDSDDSSDNSSSSELSKHNLIKLKNKC